MTAAAKEEPTMESGKQLITTLGCLACRSIVVKMEGMKGPTWKDLFGSEDELTTGKNYTADAAHLRESTLDPAKKSTKASPAPMSECPRMPASSLIRSWSPSSFICAVSPAGKGSPV